MITRTLTTYKATAYDLEFVNGKPEIHEIGCAEFSGTRPDKTAARKAISDAIGRTLPKGVEVNIVAVREVLYGMDLDKFTSMAQVIKVTELTQAEEAE